MTLDGKAFGVFAVVAGAVLLLTGLLISPALGAQDTGAQYDDDEAICQAVINIVLNTVQNNENNESSGGDQYINDISQELNVSPSIVQECVEGELGDGNPDDGDNGNDDENADGDEDGNGGEDVIESSIPDRDLPETGGVPFVGTGLLLLAGGAGLFTAVVRRGR